jgi:glycosyltransferase involved in cell wall biosynthesis
MRDALPVTCLVYTLNEEVNLPHCLSSLSWCDDVAVIDSFSTDRTEGIARAARARFVQHEFTGFGDQRNWSLTQVSLRHPWVLILDADERVPPELVAEMRERLATVPDNVAAFRLRRRFYLWGRWLRYSSLYPTWVVRLIRLGRVQYANRGHAETQVVDGSVESLGHDLIDENHKGLAEWWERQHRYAVQEARFELDQPAISFRHVFSRDPLNRRVALKSLARRLPARSLWYFLYSYFFRLGCLDGLAGLRFCLMKAKCQRLITLKKHEIRSQRTAAPATPPRSPIQ